MESDTVPFTCSVCQKQLKTKAALVNHEKKHAEKLECSKCQREFSTKFNLKKHLVVHDKVKKNSRRCSHCDFTCLNKRVLQDHLIKEHDVSIEETVLNFNSLDEVLSWKKSVEEETGSKFVKPYSATSSVKGDQKITFVCFRDGNFSSKGRGRRSLKSVGSNKINGFCPARIIVSVSSSGPCIVNYIATHLGHEHELDRLFLTKEERDSLADKIARKIPLDHILDEVRDSIVDGKLNRVHLLRKKDLRNIMRLYNLQEGSVEHTSDYSSVEAWVNHMQSTSNVVRLYKPRGISVEKYPELKDDDFLLILFNDAQKDILRNYSSNVICIDGTNGLNPYNFELYTVSILDDLNQGFPGAFLLTNRNDTFVMTVFFDILKKCCGPLAPKVFMSDLIEEFYLAWTAIMPANETKQLYCSWKVDQEWRKNLNRIRSKEKQISIYKTLKELMYERNCDIFEDLKHSVLTSLFEDGDCQDFADYFQRFLNTSANWAFCYRDDVGMDRHLENLHRSIKQIFMRGKTVKRLDKGIHAIMTMVRDKLFERMITASKGTCISKMSRIRSKHQNCDGFSLRRDADRWIVSTRAGEKEYFVTEDNIKCDCTLRCLECNTCIHAYSCTCVDYSIKWIMCKHIHYVCTVLNGADVSFEYTGDMSQDAVIIECISQTSECFDLDKAKTEIQEAFDKILESIQTKEQVEAVLKHIAPLQEIVESVDETVDCEFEIVATTSPFDASAGEFQ